MKKPLFVLLMLIIFFAWGCGDGYLSEPLLEVLNASSSVGVVETSLPDEVWAALAKAAADDQLWVTNILGADLDAASGLLESQQKLKAHDAGSIDFHALQRAYYNRYIDANGIAIVGNAAVADAHFHQARHVALVMTSRFPELRTRLRVEHGFYMFLVENQSNFMEVPEYQLDILINDRPPPPHCKTYHGATTPGKRGYCVGFIYAPPYHPMYSFSHEFAHALQSEMERLDPTFDERLKHAYRTARDTRIWHGTPVYRRIYYEYWAEGVTMWFYDIGEGRAFETYEAFAERDPLLAALLEAWFPRVAFALPSDLDYYQAKQKRERNACFHTRCYL